MKIKFWEKIFAAPARALEEGIEVGEEGLDEVCAALIAGAAEFVGDAGADQRRHGFIECLAELDCLEVFGLVVDAGQCQGLREAGRPHHDFTSSEVPSFLSAPGE